MVQGNYIFVDGSALTAQIRKLRKADPSFKDRRLCPRRFVSYLMGAALMELHGGSYKRATFYFPKGDEAGAEEYLIIPDHKRPGEVRDLHFKFCGEKLKKSAKFDKIVEDHIPEEFRDRVSKSEKGVDIEISCDALKLASASQIERLFLFTNDRDFIPLCRTLKEFGADISIIHLSPVTTPSAELLHEADSYDVIPINILQGMFLPVPQETPPPPQVSDILAAEKPDAEPSDLKVEEVEHSEEPKPMPEHDMEEQPKGKKAEGAKSEEVDKGDDE
jgi:uncharacterized LabA/DUF88 family protein